MIIDLNKFLKTERPYWDELKQVLASLERDPNRKLAFKEMKRFHYLYQRTSSDLGKIVTFSSEPEIRRYLESLVGRAFGEIHESRTRPYRFHPVRWFLNTFPQAFRRHISAFYLALAITLLGACFGGLLITLDPDAKRDILPFGHGTIHPSERVNQEESADKDRLKDKKAYFSSYLMTHNTKVSIFCMALGMTWGVGTMILLFYNGVILGALCLDYILSGETVFLLGWLLPHGAIEIPAILLASQAGLVLAGALIGLGNRSLSLKLRLRNLSGDIVTLISGVAIMLVWAGIIEAFLSQYHEPVIPYGIKIGFGVFEIVLLVTFLWRSGRKSEKKGKRDVHSS
ncbi:stage II sporulation protein M [Thermodesulfobacteriota bacterium]